MKCICCNIIRAIYIYHFLKSRGNFSYRLIILIYRCFSVTKHYMTSICPRYPRQRALSSLTKNKCLKKNKTNSRKQHLIYTFFLLRFLTFAPPFVLILACYYFCIRDTCVKAYFSYGKHLNCSKRRFNN